MDILTKVCTKCRKEKGLSNFSISKKGKFGRRADCKVCFAKHQNQYYKDTQQKWLDFIKADELFCQFCGYNKCFDALDFHHKDPKEKDYMISRLMHRYFTEENKRVLLKELAKCIILCSNCHREYHATKEIS